MIHRARRWYATAQERLRRRVFWSKFSRRGKSCSPRATSSGRPGGRSQVQAALRTSRQSIGRHNGTWFPTLIALQPLAYFHFFFIKLRSSENKTHDRMWINKVLLFFWGGQIESSAKRALDNSCRVSCGDSGCQCDTNKTLNEIDHLLLVSETGLVVTCLCGDDQVIIITNYFKQCNWR